MKNNPFIIDCDTGRDDALTLWLAQRADLPLKAVVTSYGNTTLENVIQNTSRVLALDTTDAPPILVGASTPSGKHPLFSRMVQPRQSASGNGLCDVILPDAIGQEPPAAMDDSARAAFIQKLARENGALDYYIIGPSTNFADFLKCSGDRASLSIRKVTLMAGKLGNMWDQDPVPDFNIACDPPALGKVLASNIDAYFVPLNATWPICLSLETIEQLVPDSAIAKWSQELMIAYCRHFAPEPVFRFHDPTLLFAHDYPNAWRSAQVRLDVDPDSPSFGQLQEVEKGRKVSIFETTPDLCDEIKSRILKTLGFSQI